MSNLGTLGLRAARFGLISLSLWGASASAQPEREEVCPLLIRDSPAEQAAVAAALGNPVEQVAALCAQAASAGNLSTDQQGRLGALMAAVVNALADSDPGAADALQGCIAASSPDLLRAFRCSNILSVAEIGNPLPISGE